LAEPTIQGYYEHFQYLMDFLGGDLAKEEITAEVFIGYIAHMLHEKKLKPTTVNVRIRNMRAL
jgi:integrase/recombinase XerD